MKLTGNTIFITGGGSGIGRGLAEQLHRLGNQVIISGRRAAVLKETTDANPGIQSVELDVQDAQSIEAVATRLITDYPKLNVLLNNAGIMQRDGVDQPVDQALVTSTVLTNLLGPILLSSALIEHLKAQPEAAILNVTSGLAYTPLASNATYSATKAALHSFTLSQRYMLRDTSVRVLEIAPPYVQTALTGAHQLTDPNGMPLDSYITETMELLAGPSEEILVKSVVPRRTTPERDTPELTARFNAAAGR